MKNKHIKIWNLLNSSYRDDDPYAEAVPEGSGSYNDYYSDDDDYAEAEDELEDSPR